MYLQVDFFAILVP